jgi:multidrug efflux system membrane fusion protein
MKTTLLIFLSAVFLTGCESKQESSQTEAPPIPVLATAPVIKDIPVYVESIGTLSPSIFMEVLPRVEGAVTEVLVSEGDWVKNETPLFKIDSRPYAIKLQEAEAQLAMDKASSQAAQKKYQRFKQLAQKDLVAQTEWDELESQLEITFANIELDEARVNAAKLELERCTICSPVEGRVGKLDVHPGLLVSPGQKPLATVVKMDPLIVEFTVTEKEYPKVPREKLEFEIQSLCSKEVCNKGVVTFMDNHFDSKTGLLLVRGKISNPEYAWRPGQSIRVRFPIGVNSDAKLIPQKSIRYNQSGPYVYAVQQDKTIAFRQVILGTETGSDVIVLEGLNPSEPIITDGHLRLSPGIKVEIK